jgi:hypothetical protein
MLHLVTGKRVTARTTLKPSLLGAGSGLADLVRDPAVAPATIALDILGRVVLKAKDPPPAIDQLLSHQRIVRLSGTQVAVVATIAYHGHGLGTSLGCIRMGSKPPQPSLHRESNLVQHSSRRRHKAEKLLQLVAGIVRAMGAVDYAAAYATGADLTLGAMAALPAPIQTAIADDRLDCDVRGIVLLTPLSRYPLQRGPIVRLRGDIRPAVCANQPTVSHNPVHPILSLCSVL